MPDLIFRSTIYMLDGCFCFCSLVLMCPQCECIVFSPTFMLPQIWIQNPRKTSCQDEGQLHLTRINSYPFFYFIIYDFFGCGNDHMGSLQIINIYEGWLIGFKNKPKNEVNFLIYKLMKIWSDQLWDWKHPSRFKLASEGSSMHACMHACIYIILN